MVIQVNYFSVRRDKSIRFKNNSRLKIKRSILLFHLHFSKQKKVSEKEMVIYIYRVSRRGFYTVNPSRFLCDSGWEHYKLAWFTGHNMQEILQWHISLHQMSKALKGTVREEKNDVFGGGGKLQAYLRNYSEGSVLSQVILRGWESKNPVFGLHTHASCFEYYSLQTEETDSSAYQWRKDVFLVFFLKEH